MGHTDSSDFSFIQLRRSEPAAFNMGIMMTNDWLIINSSPQDARHAVTWSIILFWVFVFFSCYKDYTSFLPPWHCFFTMVQR